MFFMFFLFLVWVYMCVCLSYIIHFLLIFWCCGGQCGCCCFYCCTLSLHSNLVSLWYFVPIPKRLFCLWLRVEMMVGSGLGGKCFVQYDASVRNLLCWGIGKFDYPKIVLVGAALRSADKNFIFALFDVSGQWWRRCPCCYADSTRHRPFHCHSSWRNRCWLSMCRSMWYH